MCLLRHSQKATGTVISSGQWLRGKLWNENFEFALEPTLGWGTIRKSLKPHESTANRASRGTEKEMGQEWKKRDSCPNKTRFSCRNTWNQFRVTIWWPCTDISLNSTGHARAPLTWILHQPQSYLAARGLSINKTDMVTVVAGPSLNDLLIECSLQITLVTVWSAILSRLHKLQMM